ncbi:MAG: hypothetical protein IKJ30_05625 [Bacilli bacterium]|nr:hypothetical protein [Bacilli bacterium]
MGSWILTYILVGIPMVGIIMMFVWAFGDKTKADPTFRNWARTMLIIELIAVILVVLYIVILLPAIMEMIAAGMPPLE